MDEKIEAILIKSWDGINAKTLISCQAGDWLHCLFQLLIFYRHCLTRAFRLQAKAADSGSGTVAGMGRDGLASHMPLLHKLTDLDRGIT